MIIGEGLPFIRDYVEEINYAIKTHSPENKLTRLQRYWLSFVNSLCKIRF
ncbi:Transposase domain protein [Rickettsiales endosymbiont of Paramecium tredecaurelia]|nr:Transposase domain protein [Candidatus Sarmatiella mevalonica]